MYLGLQIPFAHIPTITLLYHTSGVVSPVELILVQNQAPHCYPKHCLLANRPSQSLGFVDRSGGFASLCDKRYSLCFDSGIEK